ncbi:hypothetical protein QBC35DRAFT_284420 [Podospora australis]|uniref:Uncharacterized protein n=1 Tax=Podospora australis TaxID=1536484 RepID=A0AAN7AGV4_9PEZI|nr:hypothetical protein QBC35DRAFT_284420 [Podospora australis]
MRLHQGPVPTQLGPFPPSARTLSTPSRAADMIEAQVTTSQTSKQTNNGNTAGFRRLCSLFSPTWGIPRKSACLSATLRNQCVNCRNIESLSQSPGLGVDAKRQCAAGPSDPIIPYLADRTDPRTHAHTRRHPHFTSPHLPPVSFIGGPFLLLLLPQRSGSGKVEAEAWCVSRRFMETSARGRRTGRLTQVLCSCFHHTRPLSPDSVHRVHTWPNPTLLHGLRVVHVPYPMMVLYSDKSNLLCRQPTPASLDIGNASAAPHEYLSCPQ